MNPLKREVEIWRGLLLCALVLIAGCSSMQDVTPERAGITAQDVSDSQTWGSVHNVVQVKHLVFSGQPDAAALAQARAAGVDVVIDLRAPSEMSWDEGAAAAKQSLTYYNVPLPGPSATFSREAMQRISELVKENHDKKIWLHCSTGNRAAAWLAVHLVEDHDLAVDEALARARQAGLTKVGVEERVRGYLDGSDTE